METKGEGENLTVTCEAMGYPPPIIVWTRTNGALSDRVLVSGNVTTLTDDGIVSKVSVTLSIANASREDKGEYRCFANNSVGSDIITVNITIESKFLYMYPFLTTFVIVLFGQSVVLKCHTTQSQ